MSELNGIIQMHNPANDASVYPVTKQDAVIDSSGKTLSEYTEEIRGDLNKHDSSINTLENRSDGHDSSINTLIERTNTNDSSINTLIERTNTNDSSINVLESDVSTLKGGVQSLEERIIIISDIEYETLVEENNVDPEKFYYVYEVVEEDEEE